MRPDVHVFLFGDQTYDFAPDLRKLLACQNKPILGAFFEQSHYVIRAQMNLWLSPTERKVSRTSSLAHLLQKYCAGELSAAFQVALHSLTQLGSFISHYEEPGKAYPSRESSPYLVGLCTGALASAAIASSTSLSELLPAAVHTVQVALRLGLLAVDMRDRIEIPEDGKNKEWSVVFFGLEEDVATAALERFSKKKGLSNISRPFISAHVAKAITVSGPPSVLHQLKSEDELANYKCKPIPIFLPAHAPHIYSTRDVETILSTTSGPQWSGFKVALPVISGASGVFAWAGGFTSLLERALCDCLLEPIRWDKVVNNFRSLMSSRGTSTIAITPIATNLEQSMSTSLKEFALVEIEPLDLVVKSPFQPTPQSKAKLAIVGMSGRFPESPTPQAFWDLLYEGLDVCKEVPATRWNWKTHVTKDGKGHNLGGSKWGCWLDFADEFDPRFFSISPKEAPQMDPAQRMALLTTHEALESAGFVSNTTASSQNDRVGVFHGVTSNDYLECNSGQFIDTYFITGGNRAFIPGRINFCFEFCGPSFANDTACSSSLAAIHLACNSLWRGDVDTAVAGATNMCINPDGHTGLDKGFFLSRTGNCKPFDDNADGYCRGEAVATIIIKRLEDALMENDPIIGVIRDVKTNHSALSNSMTRPHADAQIDNMNAVLATANVDPTEVSYVEMHGTGTQVGDAVEMDSVLRTFAPNELARAPENPLYIGTVKANIGHGEGVSGITSLSKVLLMMKHNTIPPHCGIKPGSKINRTYPDLGARNVHIAFEPTSWKQRTTPRMAMINNFSAAGGNTALLLEDAPSREDPQGSDPRTSHIVTVTGHVAVSLKKNLQNLLDYVRKEANQGLSLSQLSWTTTARRKQHIFRVGITGSSLSEIEKELQAAIQRGDGSTRPKTKPKILFAFTGQGSQYMAMGNQLFDAFPSFKSDIINFDRIAKTLGFPSFIPIITTSEGNTDQHPAVTVQLATTSLQIALARLMKSFGIIPAAVTGHSLGMYAALCIAGVLTIVDTLFLVGKRAELLQKNCERGSHCMLAVKASKMSVEKHLAGVEYEFACLNGQEDTVISGENEHIASAQKTLSANGTKTMILRVPYAFHSAQVEPILQSFSDIAAGVSYHKPTIPVICPLIGSVVDRENVFGPSYLRRHCREPVDMVTSLQAAIHSKTIDDKTFAMEIGPHPVVCGMIKNTLGPAIRTLPILQRNADVWPNMTAALKALHSAGSDLEWTVYHTPFKAAHKVLELPAYGWDLQSYWIAYENDWCIYKPYGHPTATAQNGPPKMLADTKAEKPKQIAPPQPSVPMPETSTVHKMIEEKVDNSSALLICECDLSRNDIHNLAQGHIVNGVPFTCPSWFADMAMTIGKYALRRFAPGRSATINIADVVGDKVLVPHGRGPQPVRVSFDAKFEPNAPETIQQAKIEFYTVDAKGKTLARHGYGTLRFEDGSQLKAVESNLAHYKSRINRLHEGIEEGDFTRYNKKSGYRLMSKVADFGPDYKLLDNIVVDEENLEATCIVNFAAVSTSGIFTAHPGCVDAITQIGGFTINVREVMDFDVEVFISHGWESFQVYGNELEIDRKYTLYVQMRPDGPDFYRGDTVVLDGDNVAAFFKDVTVHRMPRKFRSAVTQAFGEGDVRKLSRKIEAPQASQAMITPLRPHSEQSGLNQSTQKLVPSNSIATKQPQGHAQISKLQAASVPAKNPGGSAATALINKVMAIVAEESGIASSELTDDSNFADIGVDSLCSMVIGSRMREDLGLDLDAEFSIFVNCPTVKDLKAFLTDLTGGKPGVEDETTEATASLLLPEPVPMPSPIRSEVAPPRSFQTDSPILGPGTPNSDDYVKIEKPSAATHIKQEKPTRSSPLVVEGLNIVAQESGIAIEDLTDDSNFADIGVDSLCSMVIQSRLREELDLDLDADFSIFIDCPTVQDLKVFLASRSEAICGSSGDNSDEPSDASTVITSPDYIDHTKADNASNDCRPATSVILQGVPKIASRTLFLLPDGSGLATSYVQIPRLESDIAVVGLNCPYIRDPEEMKCTPAAMVNSFCNEIRRRQSHGPYHLGGWSAGGPFAFACAKVLVDEGELVESLIIIDAPVPQDLGELPAEFYEYCGRLGLFGSELPPDYLIPHFLQTMKAMLPYKALPLKASRMPRVGLIWAGETVMNNPRAPKFNKKHFLLQQRTNFGPDGWDKLLPGAQFTIIAVHDANHFSMMQKQHTGSIRGLIDQVVSGSSS